MNHPLSRESFNSSAHSSLRNHPNCYAKSDDVIRFIKHLQDFPEFLDEIVRQKMSDPYFQYEYADAQVIRSDDKATFYIENCFGSFPYLERKTNIRRLIIRNCIFTDITLECAEFPHWIESVRIESTYLPSSPSKLPTSFDLRDSFRCAKEISPANAQLPKLSINTLSLILRLTNLETIPELPNQLRHLILEHNKRLKRLPELPSTLTHLYCFDSALTELPTLPPGLIKLVCWKNQLDELPSIPPSVCSICCAGNPFRKMPFINEHMYYPYADENAAVIGDFQLHIKALKVIPRFREMYYAVRLREKFKLWFWQKREREAREDLAPEKLAEYLQEHNAEETDLDDVTDRFFGLW